VIEKTGRGGSEADTWIDGGRGVSEVGRQGSADSGASGASRAESREAPVIYSTPGGTEVGERATPLAM